MSIFTMFAKQSMINRLSNPINRNRSAAKISKVMSSNACTTGKVFGGLDKGGPVCLSTWHFSQRIESWTRKRFGINLNWATVLIKRKLYMPMIRDIIEDEIVWLGLGSLALTVYGLSKREGK